MKVKNIYSIFLVLGIGFIAAGFYLYNATTKIINNGVTVEGIVVGMHKEVQDYGPYVQRAIVEYTDHTGKVRELMSASATYPPSYFEGEKLEIIYNPQDEKYPLTARIKDTLELYGGAIFMFCFGAFYIVVALVCLYILGKGGEIRFVDDPEEGYEDV